MLLDVFFFGTFRTSTDVLFQPCGHRIKIYAETLGSAYQWVFANA